MTCIVGKELVKELNLKQVTNDFVDSVERHSTIFGHFLQSNNRCGWMAMTHSLNIKSYASDMWSIALFSV